MDITQKITDAAIAKLEIQQVLDGAVKEAREAGRPWSDIGAALGISRQAARERFKHLEP